MIREAGPPGDVAKGFITGLCPDAIVAAGDTVNRWLCFCVYQWRLRSAGSLPGAEVDVQWGSRTPGNSRDAWTLKGSLTATASSVKARCPGERPETLSGAEHTRGPGVRAQGGVGRCWPQRRDSLCPARPRPSSRGCDCPWGPRQPRAVQERVVSKAGDTGDPSTATLSAPDPYRAHLSGHSARQEQDAA